MAESHERLCRFLAEEKGEHLDHLKELVFRELGGSQGIAELCGLEDLSRLAQVSKGWHKTISELDLCGRQAKEGHCSKPQVYSKCRVKCEKYVKDMIIDIESVVKEMKDHPERFLIRFGPADDSVYSRINPDFVPSLDIWEYPDPHNVYKSFYPTLSESKSQANHVIDRFNRIRVEDPSSFLVLDFGLTLIEGPLLHDQERPSAQQEKVLTIVDAQTLEPVLPSLSKASYAFASYHVQLAAKPRI